MAFATIGATSGLNPRSLHLKEPRVDRDPSGTVINLHGSFDIDIRCVYSSLGREEMPSDGKQRELAMALTPFGKAMRKLRIDHDLLLKQVADGIGVTPAFLSAVESGRKPVPGSLVDRTANWMRLGAEEAQQLRAAADESAVAVQIPLAVASAFDRSLATQLARNFDKLDESQKFAIREIIEKGSKK